MIEIWKDIKGYEGIYQVSNLGKIKSLDRIIKANSNHEYQHLRGKLLKINTCGKYCQIILCKDGVTKAFLVHRVVAEAFVPNHDNLPIVNHKDENKMNNCADNLEWCTYKYNNEYNDRVSKCKHKISKTLTGRPSNRILTDEQREHIRQGAYKGWETRRNKKEIKGE